MANQSRTMVVHVGLILVLAMAGACGGRGSGLTPPNQLGPTILPSKGALLSLHGHATKAPTPPLLPAYLPVPTLAEHRYSVFIMPVVSATPTGTPIPYLIVSQGTVGGIYTGGASCPQPDCGPNASWSRGGVPAGTDLTFTPNPAPINMLIPIALFTTTSGATPAVDTVTGSWIDGKYSGPWSQIWDIVLPNFYRIKINPSAPNPTATPTMLVGLGPYSTQSTIQGNLYTELKGSYFAATPNPSTAAGLDPTPLPTATQQARVDFVFDGQTPEPFGLSFKKLSEMPGRTTNIEFTWQTAYFDGTNYQYTGASTVATQPLPCDNLSNEVLNLFVGDRTPQDNLLIYLYGNQNTVPAVIYHSGSNPMDNTVITITGKPQVGQSITVTFVTSTQYNLAYNYVQADTTTSQVGMHPTAINADSTASTLVSTSASGSAVKLTPVAPNNPGFPVIGAIVAGGASATIKQHYTDAIAWGWVITSPGQA